MPSTSRCRRSQVLTCTVHAAAAAVCSPAGMPPPASGTARATSPGQLPRLPAWTMHHLQAALPPGRAPRRGPPEWSCQAAAASPWQSTTTAAPTALCTTPARCCGGGCHSHPQALLCSTLSKRSFFLVCMGMRCMGFARALTSRHHPPTHPRCLAPAAAAEEPPGPSAPDPCAAEGALAGGSCHWRPPQPARQRCPAPEPARQRFRRRPGDPCRPSIHARPHPCHSCISACSWHARAAGAAWSLSRWQPCCRVPCAGPVWQWGLAWPGKLIQQRGLVSDGPPPQQPPARQPAAAGGVQRASGALPPAAAGGQQEVRVGHL